ncbi:MAG: hypothetical protein JNL70_25775 [Saprospiraceae bacterium]|nr:hypothetical protein [Saprospiraceae bacterium]
MSETLIANLSQEYIDHLKEETLRAQNRLNEEEKNYQVKLNERDDTKNWHDQIHAYWERINATEKAAHKVFSDIDHLLSQAKKVNDNVEYTLEAIKLLVCNAREVSRVLATINEDYDNLKKDIDSKSKRDANFKPGQVMDKFNLLGTKLTAATQATDAAIVKVLDLAKAIFLLHHAIDSERRQHQDWIIDQVFAEYVDEGSGLKLIALHETVEVRCGERTVFEPGLQWNISKLKTLLEEGMPQPNWDTDGYPCQDSEDFVPTFPLRKGQNRYFDITQHQHCQALTEAEKAADALDDATQTKRLAESSYKAYVAALAAAQAAKTGKK